MATENRVYALPDDELYTQLVDERDLLLAQWERRSPVVKKENSSIWYQLFTLDFLIKRGRITTEDLHEAMMAEVGDALNEHYFWKYLSVISLSQLPELTTTTP